MQQLLVQKDKVSIRVRCVFDRVSKHKKEICVEDILVDLGSHIVSLPTDYRGCLKARIDTATETWKFLVRFVLKALKK